MDKLLMQFVAVAEAGTYLGAAKKLAISQPALSHNIKKLESRLGIELFIRSSRGVTLTQYGETLFESAVMMRRVYSNALGKIDRQRAEIEHGVSMGIGYSYWVLFMKEIAVEQFNRHPNAPINISIANSLRMIDLLMAGDIDIAIGHQVAHLAHKKSIEFIPLGMTRDSFFVREGHPLLTGQRTAEEVKAYPGTIAFPSEVRLRRLLSDDIRGADTQPRPDGFGHAFTSNSLEACVDFVQSTDSVLIHSGLMIPHLAKQGIVPVKMHAGEAPLAWPNGIYVRNEVASDPTVTALVDLICEHAAALNLPPVEPDRPR